jgi:hypothetical protein
MWAEDVDAIKILPSCAHRSLPGPVSIQVEGMDQLRREDMASWLRFVC